jgi:hypothetical protein
VVRSPEAGLEQAERGGWERAHARGARGGGTRAPSSWPPPASLHRSGGGDLILLREGENGLLRTVTPWARGSGGAVGSERGFPAGVVLLTPICFLCKKNVSVSRIAKNFVKLISG